MLHSSCLASSIPKSDDAPKALSNLRTKFILQHWLYLHVHIIMLILKFILFSIQNLKILRKWIYVYFYITLNYFINIRLKLTLESLTIKYHFQIWLLLWSDIIFAIDVRVGSKSLAYEVGVSAMW